MLRYDSITHWAIAKIRPNVLGWEGDKLPTFPQQAIGQRLGRRRQGINHGGKRKIAVE
jgi:hypothetical protein